MNYIVDFKPLIIELDFEKLNYIESKIKKNECLSMEEAKLFLDSLVYFVRVKINGNMNNYDYKCDLMQSMICHYLNSLSVENNPVMTLNSITSSIVGHSFVVIKLNTVNGLTPYLIDPSYIQFFKTENCNIEKYYIYKDKVLITPDPGFFIPKKDINLISNFLNNGYSPLNEYIAQLYGNSFFNTKTGIVKDEINFKSINGNIYINSFFKGHETLSKSKEELSQQGLLINSFGDFYNSNIMKL